MSLPPLSRPGRGRLLLCVIGAHLLAAWWLGAALRPRLRSERPLAEARPLWLRLVPEPAPNPRLPAPAPPPAPIPRAAKLAPLRPEPQPITVAPALDTVAQPQPQPQPISAAPAEPVAAAAPPPASAPLDLRLPKGAASQPRSLASLLRDDPRLRDRPLTATERLAQALDGTIHEEALPDGSRRFRRGNECLVARPSRAGQIDPFDSTHPKPWLVGPC
ncbi:hypothetical protein [Aquabacterium sp.]|uniref:hypothetical protein n=1 Tax=Aquabacterium sp. TaxID=1872578 RepID=UPI003783EF4C